jgi:hypothetical protein
MGGGGRLEDLAGRGEGWRDVAAGGAHVRGGGWARGTGTSTTIGVGPADDSADPWNGPEVAGVTRPVEGREEASVGAPASSEKGRTCHLDWVYILRVSAKWCAMHIRSQESSHQDDLHHPRRALLARSSIATRLPECLDLGKN